MSGMDYSAVSTNLVRAELWSQELKDILLDKLQGQQYVRWIDTFPDGTQFTIPSIGEIPMREATELAPVVYDSLDTGEVNFEIDRYVESATYITDKAKQDSYYADQLIASFVPKMRRAIEENLETSIWGISSSQTKADLNSINGAAHRFVASGDSNTTYALDKANAGGARMAVIDPSQEYVLNTLANLVNVSNNPRFEGIVNTGFVNEDTGLAFMKNIYGLDVY